MCKWIVAVFLIVIAGLCPLPSFAQSAYGPNGSDILNMMVNGYATRASAKKAIDKLLVQRRKTVQLHPKDPVAHYDLGRALKMEASYYFEVGDYTEGYSDTSRAMAEQQAAIKIKPGYADAYAALGYLQQSLGNDTGALDSYHKAVSLDPNCFIAYVDLGVYASGKYHDDQTAMADYRKAIAADPNYAGARYNLGCLLQTQAQKNGSRNDLESAAAEFRATLKLWPFFQDADYNLALAVQTLGETDQEIKLEQEAIKQNPDEPAVYVDLANLYKLQKQPDQAIPLFRKAFQLDPECSRACEDGATLMADNPPTLQEAETDYRALIRLEPQESDGHAGLGYCYRLEGKWADAVSEAKKAYALSPDSVHMGFLAFCPIHKGDYDEALPYQQELVRDDPSDASGHELLGEVLYHLGKKDEARQEWQKVLTMGDADAAAEAQKNLDQFKAADATPPASASATPSTNTSPAQTPAKSP